MCPETQVRSKLCVSVYGGEIGIYLRKNLEGAELDLHFDVKIGASVEFFTSTGILSLAKTSQPIFIDSYEGQDVNISCNHTTISTSDYIFWYRQFPNQGPQYIIQGYKTNVENEVASLFIPTDRKVSTLRLPRASLRDSAVYYCIVRTHTGTDGAAPVQYPRVGWESQPRGSPKEYLPKCLFHCTIFRWY